MKMIAIAILLGIAITGILSADMISSSISVDGTAWVLSTLTGEKNYAGLFFTNDRSTINRDLSFNDDISARTEIQSSGPIGLDEFSSLVQTEKGTKPLLCVFGESPGNTSKYDEITTSGLWSSGSYLSSRSLTSGKMATGTLMNGTGMISLNKISRAQNQIHEERSFAAGKMNISEYVEYGGESWK